MTAIDLIYAIQIAILLMCVYMIIQARHALNGLSRGLILLCLLLVIRRIDDVFQIFDQMATTVLSSAVVVVFFLDIYKLYQEREIYALYLFNRRKRMAELDEMSKADSPGES